jgi:uncharacterized protein (DUF1330 family)
MQAYVVFICREILDWEQLNTYWQRETGTLAGHSARVVVDYTRLRILEGQGPVEGVTVYEFPSMEAARTWYNSAVYREAREHRKTGGKYLVVLTEGGVPPIEQRMPRTRLRCPAQGIGVGQ